MTIFRVSYDDFNDGYPKDHLVGFFLSREVAERVASMFCLPGGLPVGRVTEHRVYSRIDQYLADRYGRETNAHT